MKNNATPEVRFEGFEEDWEEKKVIEICSISTGKSNTQDKVVDAEYPFFVRSSIIERSNKYLYDEEAVLTAGDGAGTGKIYHYVNGKYDLHQRVYRMYEFKDITGKYFFYIFSRNFYRRIKKLSAKNSVDSVRMDMIAEMIISVPKLQEQQKIGEFFKNLDETIAIAQKQILNLKQAKKGFLQKMFPKDGEKKPEVRFGGFETDWEEKTLGEICSLITKGTTPLHMGSGEINFIKVENIDPNTGNINSRTKITEQEHNGYLKRSQLQVDDILFSIAGTLGRVANIKNEHLPANTNQALAIIRLKEGINDFFVIALKSYKATNFIRKNPTVGAQPNLSLMQLGNLKIDFPSLAEQQKIGEFFKNLDELIAIAQKQLSNLQQAKKGFLQKMFV